MLLCQISAATQTDLSLTLQSFMITHSCWFGDCFSGSCYQIMYYLPGLNAGVTLGTSPNRKLKSSVTKPSVQTIIKPCNEGFSYPNVGGRGRLPSPLLVSLIFTVRRDHFLYLLYVSLSPHSPVSSYREPPRSHFGPRYLNIQTQVSPSLPQNS